MPYPPSPHVAPPTETPGIFDRFQPGVRVEGPILPEPVEVITTIPVGASIKLIAKGLRTNQVHQPFLDAAQVAQLTIGSKDEPFDGDALRFRLGVEAHRLGLAYEYDPYFSLSIACAGLRWDLAAAPSGVDARGGGTSC
jgi:hypothetical protein